MDITKTKLLGRDVYTVIDGDIVYTLGDAWNKKDDECPDGTTRYVLRNVRYQGKYLMAFGWPLYGLEVSEDPGSPRMWQGYQSGGESARFFEQMTPQPEVGLTLQAGSLAMSWSNVCRLPNGVPNLLMEHDLTIAEGGVIDYIVTRQTLVTHCLWREYATNAPFCGVNHGEQNAWKFDTAILINGATQFIREGLGQKNGAPSDYIDEGSWPMYRMRDVTENIQVCVEMPTAVPVQTGDHNDNRVIMYHAPVAGMVQTNPGDVVQHEQQVRIIAL